MSKFKDKIKILPPHEIKGDGVECRCYINFINWTVGGPLDEKTDSVCRALNGLHVPRYVSLKTGKVDQAWLNCEQGIKRAGRNLEALGKEIDIESKKILKKISLMRPTPNPNCLELNQVAGCEDIEAKANAVIADLGNGSLNEEQMARFLKYAKAEGPLLSNTDWVWWRRWVWNVATVIIRLKKELGVEENNCESCSHLGSDSQGGDYDTYSWPICDKYPNYENLNSFPFKKSMKCWWPNFWHTKFAEMFETGSKEEHTRIAKAFRDAVEKAQE